MQYVSNTTIFCHLKFKTVSAPNLYLCSSRDVCNKPTLCDINTCGQAFCKQGSLLSFYQTVRATIVRIPYQQMPYQWNDLDCIYLTMYKTT